VTPPGVAILLPGGVPRSIRRAPRNGLASLRMRTFQRSLERAGVDTELLTYRYRGWNDGDPISDAATAIAKVRAARPEAPIVLVGHSMGGRVALRLADEPGIAGVVVLAPWLPPGEPLAQIAGNTVLLIHGDRDRLTDPARTLTFARAAAALTQRLAFVELRGGEHKLLRRGGVWHDLVRRFTVGEAGAGPRDEEIEGWFTLPAAERSRLRR
jgi:pimeloyl-ACP methyl ester carboxylesterase